MSPTPQGDDKPSLAERVDPARIRELEANHAKVQGILQLRATTALGEVIDGLNTLVQRAALGDRDSRQALRQLWKHLDRARAVISVDLPDEPRANGT